MGVGRQQTAIRGHSIAANLITEDQNTQVPGLKVNEKLFTSQSGGNAVELKLEYILELDFILQGPKVNQLKSCFKDHSI